MFSWILQRGGAARGHLRSPASTAGGCDSAALTRVGSCGPTPPICQCNDCSSVAGVNSGGMREKAWRLIPEGGTRCEEPIGIPSPGFVFIPVEVGSVIWVSIQRAGL